jgi:hypothetical protein
MNNLTTPVFMLGDRRASFQAKSTNIYLLHIIYRLNRGMMNMATNNAVC